MDTEDQTMNLEASHESLVERLTLLAGDPELDDGQRELAQAWRKRLDSARRRALAPLSVAFLAQVGTGKSTLVAAATGLRLPGTQSPKKWSVLPVGDGRTTLGETRVVFEERNDVQLEVEPMSIDELRTELRLFARDLWASTKGKPSGVAGNAGEELYGLLRRWIAREEGDPRAVSVSLAQGVADAEELEAKLLSRLDLEKRSQSLIRRFSADESGLGELQDVLQRVMHGDLDEGPAPRTVRIALPMTELGRHVGTIIDTQGIDSSNAPDAMIKGRADLRRIFVDPDTLLVLCSGFESAPDLVSRNVLAAFERAVGGHAEMGAWRLLLVDRRDHEDGPHEEWVHDRHERLAQCHDELRRSGDPVAQGAVIAIDARMEAEGLQQLLVDMSTESRRRRVRLWERALLDTEEAISTLGDVELTAQARELELRLWWVWDAALARVKAAPVNGLSELGDVLGANAGVIQHWSHLNAAVRRRGRYKALDLASLGGAVASLFAERPYAQGLKEVKEFVALVSNQHGPQVAKQLQLRLDHLEKEVEEYGAELALAWEDALSRYFASDRSDELWAWCEARWGQGSGYTPDVANRIREEARHAALELDAGRRPIPLESRLPPRPELLSLREIEIRNFRGVELRSISIANSITVLVGDNGMGKTCWLEAIAAAIGVLLPAMDAGPAPVVRKDDVRQVIRVLLGVPDRQYQLPMSLRVRAVVQGRLLSWSRHIESSSDDPVTEGDALQVIARKISEEIRSHSERQLPILAYYGTQRLWPSDIEPDVERREVGSRFDGYSECLEPASTHRNMMDWIRHFTFVELQRKEPVVQLKAIEQAVISCVEGAKRFYYDVALEELALVMEDGDVVLFRMLSDGYRNIAAIVADIAWRATVLNPQLGDQAPAFAEGVVLIDEIDLHLHPKWQRRVLLDLRKAFPRLQIITTTHSPFIIQSLRPGELVNLDPGAEEVPYANESPEDIAEHVMGVKLPQRSELRRREYEAAKSYYDLLELVPHADELELARLKAKLDEILAPYAENQAFVAFLERKRVLAEAKRP